MPSVDLPLEQLRGYRPAARPPSDLADFWAATLAPARVGEGPTRLRLEPTGPRLAGVECFSATFAGFGGVRVHGWYVRPPAAGAAGPLPGVVVYHGYGGRAPRPLELYTLAAQGVAVLSMDCRGQTGDTPGGTEPSTHVAGWLTAGLAEPVGYYYRAVYADAVLAIEALAAEEGVDGARIALTGVSQGGGLTLAAAALSRRPAFAWADVPFLCDFERALEVATEDPYPEVAALLRRRPELVARAFQTLAYFDVANLAPRLSCPVVVTVGLWDPVCPPSTVFGAFNRIASADKDLRVWPYHGHSLGYENDEQRLAELLRRLGR